MGKANAIVAHVIRKTHGPTDILSLVMAQNEEGDEDINAGIVAETSDRTQKRRQIVELTFSHHGNILSSVDSAQHPLRPTEREIQHSSKRSWDRIMQKLRVAFRNLSRENDVPHKQLGLIAADLDRNILRLERQFRPTSRQGHRRDQGIQAQSREETRTAERTFMLH